MCVKQSNDINQIPLKERKMYNNNPLGAGGTPAEMPLSRAQVRISGDIPASELVNRNTVRRRCNGTLARQDEVVGFDNVENGCTRNNSCGISCTGWGLNNHPVAMVYSPCQPWNNVYKLEVALERGTLFKDLDLPFEPKQRRGGC
jgi:hypothetical protein